MKIIVVTVIALVLTLLASSSNAYDRSIVKLEMCGHAYAGVNQTCGGIQRSQCIGDSFCAENRCIPKQIFIGQQCAHHYECYRGFGVNENPAIFCDKTDNKCKWTKEVDAKCQSNIECQSRKCSNNICTQKVIGDVCTLDYDCLPFETELFGCVNSRCEAKPKAGNPCRGLSNECHSSAWCVKGSCVPLDYKKEGDSCTIGGDIPFNVCRPNRDGAAGSDMMCIDKICTYPPRLREYCNATNNCVSAYAESCNGNLGTCQKQPCSSNNNCDFSSEFCDCTNLVCMNRNYGNRIHECSFVDGLRGTRETSFTRCLAEKCPGTVYTSSAVMENSNSCPAKKCRGQYKEYVNCVIKAGEEYGAENPYFFGF